MITFLNYVIFIIEVFCLVILVKRTGLKNLWTIMYFTSFYYCQSVFLDYLLLGKDRVRSTDKNILISVSEPNYLLANLSYFLFLIPLFFFALKNKKIIRNPPLQAYGENTLTFSVFLVLLGVYNVIAFFLHFGLERAQIGATQNPVTIILYNLSMYTGIFVATALKKQNLVSVVYVVSLLVVLIFSFEREPIMVIGLVLLFRFPEKFSDKMVLLLAPVGLVVLAYYKLFFSTILYATGSGFAGFQTGVETTEFSLAGIDPLSSFTILCDFFTKNVFTEYTLSYFTNFYGQMHRMFFGGDYKSLSEYASIYYANGTYGVAFSMILESLINFSFFGPVILAAAVSGVYKKVYKGRENFFITLVVIVAFIGIKFIRTELMTLLKIHILPAFIAYYIFTFLTKRQLRTKNE